MQWAIKEWVKAQRVVAQQTALVAVAWLMAVAWMGAGWGGAAAAPPAAAAPSAAAAPPAAAAQALQAARAAACAYEDALTLVLADAELAVQAALRSPTSGDAATAERRSRAQQAVRGRKLLRESLERLRKTEIKSLVQASAAPLPAAASPVCRALLDEVRSDEASLAQVLELLADRGPDRFASFLRAQRRVQDLQKGSPAQRRRAAITEIRKLAAKSP
ncbi:MAG: hypothetical protein U0636_03675 [Phycisphaerales bacterium]